jgi:hypothetical protein
MARLKVGQGQASCGRALLAAVPQPDGALSDTSAVRDEPSPGCDVLDRQMQKLDLFRSSALPGARWPAGGSLRPGSGGGHPGSSGTGVCLPWPSGTRSWATPATGRPPRRPADTGEAQVRSCFWVGLPRRIPFRRRTRCAAGPECGRIFVRPTASLMAAATPAGAQDEQDDHADRSNCRHSPLGLFQRVCYLVHAAGDS